MGDWKWFEVKFNLGVPPGADIPTDPLKFLKWLQEEPMKYLDSIDLRPAELKTAPF